MGCITSSQKDVDGAPSGEVKALSTDMKTRFANVDPEVLGDYKEEAVAELAFVYGRTTNVYIIKTPPFHPAQDAEYTKEQAKAEGGEKQKADGEEGQEDQAESPKEKPVKETRWTIFNDSKESAKVEATFFHAEALRSAGSEESVKVHRGDNGVVKATVEVPAGATVAFVEGPINGYMYKCMVHDAKTNTFELAAPAK